jgi:tetratricopeptide (TPR) repeat protein
MVCRSFADVFPNNALFWTMGNDYLMVGINGEHPLSLENAQAALPYAQRSTNISIPSAPMLFNLVLTEDLFALAGDGPVNSDDRPGLEFLAPRRMFHVNAGLGGRLQRNRRFSPSTERIRAGLEHDWTERVNFAQMQLSLGRNAVDIPADAPISPELRARHVANMVAYARLHSLEFDRTSDPELQRLCLETQIETLRSALPVSERPQWSHCVMADMLAHLGRLDEAEIEYRRSMALDAGITDPRLQLGSVLYRLGRFAEALTLLREAEAIQARAGMSDLADTRLNIQLTQLMLDEQNLPPGDRAAAESLRRRAVEFSGRITSDDPRRAKVETLAARLRSPPTAPPGESGSS